MVCINLLNQKEKQCKNVINHEMLTTINDAYFLLLCYIVNL